MLCLGNDHLTLGGGGLWLFILFFSVVKIYRKKISQRWKQYIFWPYRFQQEILVHFEDKLPIHVKQSDFYFLCKYILARELENIAPHLRINWPSLPLYGSSDHNKILTLYYNCMYMHLDYMVWYIGNACDFLNCFYFTKWKFNSTKIIVLKLK